MAELQVDWLCAGGTCSWQPTPGFAARSCSAVRVHMHSKDVAYLTTEWPWEGQNPSLSTQGSLCLAWSIWHSTHPTWTPGKVCWSFLLPLSLCSWFCCWIQWSAEYQAAFPSQNLLLDPSDWHFPRPHQQISFISSASADHKDYQDLFNFPDTNGISPDL